MTQTSATPGMLAIVASVSFALLPLPAAAEVFPQGDSFIASANATIPGCTDGSGGAGATAAAASCPASQGYAAAAAAAVHVSSDAKGGEASASGEATASVPGGQGQTSTGSAGVAGNASWTTTGSTLYSLGTSAFGGATVVFTQGADPTPLPPSGTLAAGTYTLRVNADAFAQALDANGASLVISGPRGSAGRVTFAELGASDLVSGTALAGGVAKSGLRVEALDGTAIVATTTTGDDGSYLLPDLATSVTVRVSDPGGGFAPSTSPLLTPPDTFVADLAPAAVPGPGAPGAGALALLLLLFGRRARSRSHPRSRAIAT